MKYLIATLFILAFAADIDGQQFRFGAGYNYTYSPRWDKAIQTYNFSRPDLEKKQPLLIHGYYAGASMFFYETLYATGISVSYHYTRSAVKNDNFDASLHLHLISLGYLLHYEKPVASNSIYFEGQLSLLVGGIFRQVNGEALQNDGKKIRAPGLGGEIGISAGYRIALNERFGLSPFLQVRYSPWYYSPASEAVLNQTIGLSGPKWAMILSGQVGINVHFIKS